MNFEKDDVIFSYSREQAIEDGVLVDVTETAKEAGFKIPVAITAGVHELCQPPKELEDCQDYKGRLWDVLFMAAVAFRAKKDRIVPYKVIFAVTRSSKKTETLWIVFNEAEGFTIMKPEEY